MSETCEIVLVNGGLRVNKTDYLADQAQDGPKQYTLDQAQQPAPVEIKQPSFVQFMVTKAGSGKSVRFFVVDASGKNVTNHQGIDSNGYATEADAWAAVTAAASPA